MFYRLYTGEDAQSHMETYDVPDVMPVVEMVFRKHEPGSFIDWHPAPRRQFIITLEGEVEIGLGDGSTYKLGPGDVMLAEDLDGQGHTTRAVGDVPRVSVAIPVE
ncbi:MAG: cupin domain-containing protein [Dehalococcoidia bacterium]